jgi:CBS domain-containing protein
MTVRAILDTKGHQVLSVAPDVKLSAAVKLLGEKKIGAVLVMNEGRVEGILSERDIVRVLGERGARVLEEPVSEVMTTKVVSCRQSDTVAGIMEMMTLGKFRHLPVIEEGKVVGLISIGDIVKWRMDELADEGQRLREYGRPFGKASFEYAVVNGDGKVEIGALGKVELVGISGKPELKLLVERQAAAHAGVARVRSGGRTARPARRSDSNACGEVTSCTRWRSM